MAKKILIDTDPGIDDAVAISLAFASSDVEVVAVTATGGNVPPDRATRNLQIVLEQLDPSPRPRMAMALPGQELRVHSRQIHGPNGLGGEEFSVSELQHRHQSDKLIADTVRRYPDELTILALGPLSNIASALQRDPEIANMIGHLVISAGAMTAPGNVTAAAEFNIYCDAEAARAVIDSPVTKTMIPLDVTGRIRFGYDFLDKLPLESTQTGSFLRQILPAAYRGFYQRYGIEGVYLHDVISLVATIHPGLVTTESLFCAIETEGELTHGMTIFDRRSGAPLQPNVDVATDIDTTAAMDCILRLLAKVR